MKWCTVKFKIWYSIRITDGTFTPNAIIVRLLSTWRLEGFQFQYIIRRTTYLKYDYLNDYDDTTTGI